MGDENNSKIDPDTQKKLMELAATDPDAYAAKLKELGIDNPDPNAKLYQAARNASGAVVDAASNAGKSLMNLFGGSDPSLGNQINDNIQTLAKKRALQRLQGQNGQGNQSQ